MNVYFLFSRTASAAQAPSMNYRQLEELINKWTLDLEEQESIFLQQALQVNAWDRLLIENGDSVSKLTVWLKLESFRMSKLL